MTTKRTPKRAKRPTKRAHDAPISLARTLEAVRRSGAPAPAGLARETIVESLLALADPARKAEHHDAAQCVAEAVTLASITAARQLVAMHEGDSAWHPEVRS